MRIPHVDEYDVSHMALGEAVEWSRLAGAVLDLLRESNIDDMDPVFVQLVIEDPGAFTPDDIRMELAVAEMESIPSRAIE